MELGSNNIFSILERSTGPSLSRRANNNPGTSFAEKLDPNYQEPKKAPEVKETQKSQENTEQASTKPTHAKDTTSRKNDTHNGPDRSTVVEEKSVDSDVKTPTIVEGLIDSIERQLQKQQTDAEGDSIPIEESLIVTSECDTEGAALSNIKSIEDKVTDPIGKAETDTENYSQPSIVKYTDSPNTQNTDTREIEEPEPVATIVPTNKTVAAQEFTADSSIEVKIAFQELDINASDITNKAKNVITEDAEFHPEPINKDFTLAAKDANTQSTNLQTGEIKAPKLQDMEQQTPKLQLNEVSREKVADIEQIKIQAPQVSTSNKLPIELRSIVKSVEAISPPTATQAVAKNPAADMNFDQSLSGENEGDNILPKTTPEFEAMQLFDNDEALTARSDIASTLGIKSDQAKTSEVVLNQIKTPIAKAAENPVSVNESRGLVITLTPESLGTIVVTLEREATGQLKVHLTVDSEKTYLAIRETQAEIIEDLKSVTEGDNTSFTFDLPKGSHEHSGYDNAHNRFLNDHNADEATSGPEAAKKITSYKNTLGYNDGVDLIL